MNHLDASIRERHDIKIKTANTVPNIKFSFSTTFRTGLFQIPISIKNNNNRDEAIEKLANNEEKLEFNSFIDPLRSNITNLKELIEFLKKRENFDNSRCLITILISACLGSSSSFNIENSRCMIDLLTYTKNIVSYIDNGVLYTNVKYGYYDAVMANRYGNKQTGGSNNYYNKYIKYKTKYLEFKSRNPNSRLI